MVSSTQQPIHRQAQATTTRSTQQQQSYASQSSPRALIYIAMRFICCAYALVRQKVHSRATVSGSLYRCTRSWIVNGVACDTHTHTHVKLLLIHLTINNFKRASLLAILSHY